MAASTKIRTGLNRVLGCINLRLDTLTADRIERTRLKSLESNGHFEQPILPVPDAFERMDPDALLQAMSGYSERFDSFVDPKKNDVGYAFENNFFSSPDTELLYTVVRTYQPRRFVEVGSGHSTKVVRQAILDGELDTQLTSIDPYPRTEIADVTDELLAQRVETVTDPAVFGQLESGDVLFIDSSHEIKPGNDVVFLFLNVLPRLPAGVIVHVHEISLPYEYPRDWIVKHRWGWSEQYLVQSLLMNTDRFDVLWAGCYLQKTMANFATYFPHLGGQIAQSLWMRTLG